MSVKSRTVFLVGVLVLLMTTLSPLLAQDEHPAGPATSSQSLIAASTEMINQPAAFSIMECGVTYASDIASVGQSRFWTIEPLPGKPFTIIAITEPYRPASSSVDTVLKLWSTVGLQVTFHTMNDDMDGHDSWLHYTSAYNNPNSPTGARYDVEIYDTNGQGTGRVDLYWDYVTYFSVRTKGTVQRISYTPGDILAYDYCRNRFRMVFDASDVGYGGRVNLTDMALVNRWTFLSKNGAILLAFANSNDVVAFYPANLGSTTQGGKLTTFHGSDVGLATTAERLDGVTIALDGNLMIGTKGSAKVPGLTFGGEDLVRFVSSAYGSDTSGTYSPEFDGSDEGLNPRVGQPLGIWYSLDHAYHKLTGNWYPQWYMTFDRQVTLPPSLIIPPDRIAICRVVSPAPNTSCVWSLDSYFPGIPGSDPIVDGVDKGNWQLPSTLP